ncbi:13090_t:CDS:2, partial [Funneliformis geosporum]
MASNKKFYPIHPGIMLKEDLLIAKNISQVQLAQDINLPVQQIRGICSGKKPITPNLSFRLGIYFGMSPNFWLNLQNDYEQECLKDILESQESGAFLLGKNSPSRTSNYSEGNNPSKEKNKKPSKSPPPPPYQWPNNNFSNKTLAKAIKDDLKDALINKSYLGVLPIINPEVIYLGLKLASVLEMKINQIILFDRKIYNYFDLPKGYQITQQALPFANSGFLPIIKGNRIERIPIKILQLEEDTAKSIYSKEGIKLDFNRAGNPLIELVTEPVFHQVETVLLFIKQLQNLLRYLEISEAKMEKGQLRVDLNFSLQLGNKYSTPRYEIKNLNSLANIEKALKHEVNKHQLLFSEGQEPPISQTLGFDEEQQITITHREKTNYYYLPEVNIPPIKLK